MGRLQRGDFLDAHLFAIEQNRVQFDAQDTGRTAADVHLAVGDCRRAFHVHQFAGHVQGPIKKAAIGRQAVQHGAIGLVHPLAEDDLVADDGRGANGRQAQERGGLVPGRFDGLRILGRSGQRQHVRSVESADGREQNRIPRRHGRGDKVLVALHGPFELRGRGGAGFAIGVAGPAGAASIGGPGGILGQDTRRQRQQQDREISQHKTHRWLGGFGNRFTSDRRDYFLAGAGSALGFQRTRAGASVTASLRVCTFSPSTRRIS